MKTHHIAHSTLSPRKGEAIPTRWRIVAYGDLPSLGGRPGWPQWQGVPSPHRGGEQRITPAHYVAQLLRPDLGEQVGDRNDHAGFAGHPSPLTLRGADLGEVSAELTPGREGSWWARWRVRGHEAPTPGERKWLDEQALPHLSSYLDDHRAELDAEYVERYRAHGAEQVADALRQVEKMGEEFAAIMAKYA